MNADDLRERFMAAAGVAGSGEDCPPPDQIWDAVSDEQSDARFGKILDHVVSCPACAIAWRLARDFGARERSPATAAAAPRIAVWRRWGVPAAVAACLLVVAGLAAQWWWTEGEHTGAIRMPQDEVIRSLVSEQTRCARSEVWLRWSPIGADTTRYTVRVLSEDLKLLHSASLLERPEYHVPESVFAGLAPGARVLWQVDATLVDGQRQTSGTFLVRIE